MADQYTSIASDEVIENAVKALNDNGFNAQVVESKEAAKDLVLSLVPKGSEVFTNTSVTLDEIGISEALNGADYVSARDKMMALYAEPAKKKEMKRIASASDYVLGSVHAVTEDGKLMIASASGSQLPGEAYGADKVIFVVGAQKLVKNLATGLERIEEHVVPLEDTRAQAAYGSRTNFAKLLVLNAEVVPERTTVVVVKENVGF